MDYSAIGQRIKRSRRARGMTQEHLAEALTVSVGYISQIERGVTKISLDTLAAVATRLECELAELVTGVAVSQEHYLDRELAQGLEDSVFVELLEEMENKVWKQLNMPTGV